MLTEFRKTAETPTFVLGEVFSQNDDLSWEKRTDACVARIGMWFDGSPSEILARLGVTCSDPKRAVDLSNLFDGDLSGYYYVAAASPSGSEEAIKWIMGGLASYLNENSLSFKDCSRVLPADYLLAFCTQLEQGRIERNFAKEIFAELLKADRFHNQEDPDTGWLTDVGEMSWEEYEALLDSGAIEARYREFENRTTMTGRISADDVLRGIVDDPRFKAVDTSEIDTIIDKVMADNPAEVAKARANPRAVNWFIGQVRKASEGRADAQVIQQKLKERFPS